MKKILPIFIIPLLLSSCTTHQSEEPHFTPQDFENVYFNDKSLVYDGESHILDEVRGAPEGTLITYDGRQIHIDAGTYRATALLQKEGYNDKTLEATLTINKASFENITFENATFTYDGNAHSIYVSGAPSFATVTYTNNGKTSVGTYTVKATISAPNYNTLTKTATMHILGKTITGVTFSDKSFEYDGDTHYIYVDGDLPEGVSVTYSNNGKIDSGSYKVKALLKGEGYEPEELTATLTITPVEIEKPGYFHSKFFYYDGKNHSVEVTDAPNYSTITYKCLNATGKNTFKERGIYYIEATVMININHASVLTATLTISDEPYLGVDESKECLPINEELTWDQLYSALDKSNFTYKYSYGSYDVEDIDDPYPLEIFNDEINEYNQGCSIFGTDGTVAYNFAKYEDEDLLDEIVVYQEVGDDMVSFSADIGGRSDYYKIPKAAFKETVCDIRAAEALVALTKGENGEFLPGVDGDDFYGDVGICFIEDGVFTVLKQHPRTLDSGYYRYFYSIYKFFNIGNTKIDIPDNYFPSEEYIKDNVGFDDYYLDGVRYLYSGYNAYYNPSYYTAMLYVNFRRALFLKPGVHTVLPYIYDNVVLAIIFINIGYDYNRDQSPYTFNLYINEGKEYQGEYAALGSLKRFYVSTFLYYGGTINYYDEWHS